MATHTRIVSKGNSHFSVDVQLIKCPKCSSHFKKTYNFERHMKSHHSEKFETGDNSNIVFYRDFFSIDTGMDSWLNESKDHCKELEDYNV